VFINKYLSLVVILPHRGITRGKSRLAEVLDDDKRAQLNRWLLNRTLHIAVDWLGNARNCVVVSACDEVLALAQKSGATALRELDRGGSDSLNAALAQATAHAFSLSAKHVLILPCDLPLLTPDALQEMAALPSHDSDMVIAPDRHHAGTNVLLVDATLREFAFGQQSLARHVALSASRGARALLCERDDLAFDLDTPADYRIWVNEGGGIPGMHTGSMIETR
jgi:2-phospho-L-lactate guanylyltransferase